MIDLHTHTVFSDGALIPAELVRRAAWAGYRSVAITDHADHSTMAWILERQRHGLQQMAQYLDIGVHLGIELTHVPPALIPGLVEEARDLGAELVVVHGETVAEPVAPGTNLAALEAGVDILAHPGLMTEEEARLAAENDIALEISTRAGHAVTNGHVVKLAEKYGVRLVINNDAHAPADFVSADYRKRVALGAGLSEEGYAKANANSGAIVQQMLRRLLSGGRDASI